MTAPDLVAQAHALLDSLWSIHRRMTGPDDAAPEGPYNDYYLEQVEDMIGQAIRRLERRERNQSPRPTRAPGYHLWRAGRVTIPRRGCPLSAAPG